MPELLIATKNPGKFREIREILDGLDWKFLFLVDFLEALKRDAAAEIFESGATLEALERGPAGISDFLEDGQTFQENALKKAKYYFERTGFLTLAEDSGILVEALKGELGVKTRRWGLGETASDQEWVRYFLDKMEPEQNRGAEFVCSACLYGKGICEFFEGKTRGSITEQLEAQILPGIPLSSCFRPQGMGKVYAALSLEEKNKVSHRGKAMLKVREWLGDRLFNFSSV